MEDYTEGLKLGNIFADLQNLQNAPPTTTTFLSNISKSAGKTKSKSIKTFESNQMDENIKRAKSLVALAEFREKFKETGDTGLALAKKKVDTVLAGYVMSQVKN
ncbi:hypothetical protein HI914_01729 [Erysiphe necator]|nr:hypothetical protein HI914_01729 [Erysiphe necator]